MNVNRNLSHIWVIILRRFEGNERENVEKSFKKLMQFENGEFFFFQKFFRIIIFFKKNLDYDTDM